MKIFKRLTIGVICIAVVLSFTSCSDTSWVVKSGDNVVTGGMYLGYEMNALMSIFQHKDYNQEIDDPIKQTIDGKDGKTYIKDTALESAKTYLYIENKFKDMGLELSAEDIDNQDKRFNFEWDYYSALFEKNGTSKESYKKLSDNRAKQELIFKTLYSEGGEKAVSDADLLVHFKENYVDINYIEMTTTDDQNKPLPADQIQKIKDKAKAYAQRIKNGESLNKVKVEYQNENIPEGEEKNTIISDDKETKEVLSKNDEYTDADLLKAAFAEKQLDTPVVVEGKEAVFVMVKYDVTRDETNFDKMRTQVLANLKGEEFKTAVKDEVAKLDVTVNSAAVSYYNPSKLTLDTGAND